jgi:hypothetical protein
VNVMKQFEMAMRTAASAALTVHTHIHCIFSNMYATIRTPTCMPILSICASIVPSDRPPALDNSQFASEVKAAHHSRIPTNAVSNTDGRQDPGPAAATTGHASASR